MELEHSPSQIQTDKPTETLVTPIAVDRVELKIDQTSSTGMRDSASEDGEVSDSDDSVAPTFNPGPSNPNVDTSKKSRRKRRPGRNRHRKNKSGASCTH